MTPESLAEYRLGLIRELVEDRFHTAFVLTFQLREALAAVPPEWSSEVTGAAQSDQQHRSRPESSGADGGML